MAELGSAVQLVAVAVVVAKAGQARQRAQGASLVPPEPLARHLVPSGRVPHLGRIPAPPRSTPPSTPSASDRVSAVDRRGSFPSFERARPRAKWSPEAVFRRDPSRAAAFGVAGVEPPAALSWHTWGHPLGRCQWVLVAQLTGLTPVNC